MSRIWWLRLGSGGFLFALSFMSCASANDDPTVTTKALVRPSGEKGSQSEPLPTKPMPEAVAGEKGDDEPPLPELSKLDPLPPVDSPSASLFVPPIGWYVKASTVERSRVLNEAKGLLKLEWNELTKPKADSAAKRFEDLCRSCPSDPRLPYAFGLFLWQSDRPDSAIAQFEASAKRDSRFFAAHQAAVWCRIQQGQTSNGIERLQRLVNELAAAEKTGLSPIDQRLTAEWLGRVVGYFTHVAEKKPTDQELQSLQQSIQQKLSADRQAHVATGMQLAAAYAKKLETVAAQPAQSIAKELKQQDTKVRKQLEEVTSTLQGHRDSIRVEHQKVQTLQDQINDGNKEIHKSQGGITLAGTKASKLQRSSYGTWVEEQVAQYRTVKNEDREVTYFGNDGKTVTEKIKGRGTRKVFDGYKTVRTQLPETKDQAQQRQNDIMQQRGIQNSLKADNEQRLAELKPIREQLPIELLAYRKFVASLQDDIDQLESQKYDLQREHEALSKFAIHPETFQKYIRSIAPYAPWDVDLQKKLLDESFHAKLPAPPNK